MTDTETAPVPKIKKTPKVPCGWCLAGSHKDCRVAFRNGDRSPVVCTCCGASATPRCMDCGNQVYGEVDTHTFTCLDRDACQTTRDVRREQGPIAKFLREYHAKATAAAHAQLGDVPPRKEPYEIRIEPSFKLTGTDTTPTQEQAETWSKGVFGSLPPEVQAKAVRRPRPGKASCRCCGEPTKGGTFLPGHDARYISSLARDVSLGCLDREAALAAVNDKPALMAKLERKLAK